MLDVDDIALAILEACGGEVEGRTRLQKLGYFIAECMNLDAGYEPHYYGPYSSAVAAAVDGQVGRGILVESVERLGRMGFFGHDAEHRRYDYAITQKGHRALEWRRSQDPRAFQQAETIARRIHEGPSDARLLSYAAKLHVILRQSGAPLTLRSARERATREYGWRMPEGAMGRAADLLEQLGLVETDE